MPVAYRRLPTEKSNRRTRNLDLFSIHKILHTVNQEDASVPHAVRKVIPAIARAVRIIVASLNANGKLFFVGAGTSGRLGVMEAAECPPTFATPPSLVQAIVAGGRASVFRSREGAEDHTDAARLEIRKRVSKQDVVVGIAASGVTPFVAAALREAKRRRAKTILLTCHPHPPMNSKADVRISPQTGPEVIAGSTRLKAGTATKLILNMLTVASMVRLGKVYGNRMVDLMPRSAKLRARALRLIEELGRVSKARAWHYFRKSGGRAKLAIVMARLGKTKREALKLLQQSQCLPLD